MNIIISYLLPVFYFVLIAFLLKRNKYLLINDFSALAIITFFTFKCLAGIIADFISIHYFKQGGDNWLYFSDGLQLYQIFIHSPANFVSTVSQMFSINDFDIFNPDSDFIRTVSEGIKFLHFIGNLFSFGNIYTNTILFNAVATIVFLRCWIFLNRYTSGWVCGAFIFLMPSVFFYTSNILKEGIAYLLLALLIPLVHKLYRKPGLLQVAGFAALFLLLFFFKFLIAVTFAASMVIWLLVCWLPQHKPAVLLSALIIGIAFFFLSAYVQHFPNLPQYLVNRQQEFLALEANSAIHKQVLQPGFYSFLKALPSAAAHVLFRPFPGEGGQLLYQVHAVEIYLCWALIIFLAIKNRFRLQPSLVKPLFWGMFFFAVANLLIIGYIIPNIGAIVRYRSIFLPWFGIFFWFIFNGNHLLPKYYKVLGWRRSK